MATKFPPQDPAPRSWLEPEPEPMRGPEHDALQIFAGTWSAEGSSRPGVRMLPDEKVRATAIYRWLPGRYFMQLREDAWFGNVEHKTVMIIGFDRRHKSYFATFFDNMGYTRRYEISVDGRTWTFVGERERATYCFGTTDHTMSIRWERRSADNVRWERFCELHARRTHATPMDFIHSSLSAQTTKNRDVLENLLSSDFTFTSPEDDHIDKRTYFERRWPMSEHIRTQRVERVFENGNEAFVAYETELDDGRRVRSTEYVRTEGGKIKEIEVFFGKQ